MRRLTPGDLARKLAHIEVSERSRTWKERARRKLLKDVGAVDNQGSIDLPTGRICAKRRFPGFNAAMMALLDTQKSLNPERHEKRVYPCSHCKGWHLTSSPLIEELANGRKENDYTTEEIDEHRSQSGEGEGRWHRDTEGPP